MNSKVAMLRPLVGGRWRLTWRLLVVVALALALVLVVVGVLTYVVVENYLRAKADTQLSYVADLRVGEVERFRAERPADAADLASNPTFVAFLRRVVDHPSDQASRGDVEAWLANLVARQGYAQQVRKVLGS
jgi:hypothetical protein